ncbi:hypothetical protein IMZ48_08735 [Candidatus Bathyarchaeota archaeon]|nr:hypothetical protein [Candidatus Bathyarchaeota archaeon]
MKAIMRTFSKYGALVAGVVKFLGFAVLVDAEDGPVGELPIYGPRAEMLNLGERGCIVVADHAANLLGQFWLTRAGVS